MDDNLRMCKNGEFSSVIEGDLIISHGVVALVEGLVGGDLIIEDDAQVLLLGLIKKDVKMGPRSIFENKGYVGGEVVAAQPKAIVA